VWKSRRSSRAPLAWFTAQLAFNALWSWLFFAWHRGALATFEVAVLLALIIATTVTFWRTSRLAGMLLVPYLLWVSFASVLTFSVWQRNPALL
jgi:tryptophan-rich sensory protein